MPMTLNVGLSRKIGLPDYGSLGASCNVQVELPGNLIFDDLEAFHRQVRQAYAACAMAVSEELARQQAVNTSGAVSQPTPTGNARHNGDGAGRATPRRSSGRRATASQARALRAIADRQGPDLAAELRSRFGVEQPEDLSISEASQLIDELKASADGHGVGRQ